MALSKFCVFQLYRVEPGDLGIADQPSADPSPDDAVKTLSKILLAHYKNQSVLGPDKPHHGRVVLSDKTVFAELMVLPDGTTERVD